MKKLPENDTTDPNMEEKSSLAMKAKNSFLTWFNTNPDGSLVSPLAMINSSNRLIGSLIFTKINS